MQRVKSKIYGLLKWGEEQTQTDITYMAKGGFWLSLDTITSMLSAFVLMLVFGNLILPEIYGVYRYVLSLYSLLAIFGLAGFDIAVTRAVAKNSEGDFWNGFKIKFFGSLLGTILSFALALFYFINDNLMLAKALLMIGFSLPLIEPFGIYTNFLNGKKKFRTLSFALVFSQIFSMLMLLAAIFLKANVFWLLVSYFAGWAITRIFFFCYSVKKFKPNDVKDEKTVKLGINITLISVLDTIASYIDRIALFHFLGPIEVAIYSFAIAPTEQMKGILKNVQNLALPRFSQRTQKELDKTVFKKMFLLIATMLPVVLIYIIITPLFFKIFLPKYLAAIPLSQIFSITLLTAGLIAPLTAMQAIPKIRGLYVFNIISPVINIGLILILIPIYGIWGAITARVVARFTSLVVSILAFKLL